MTEIKIAICDDEQVFRDQIVGMASDILKEAHISYEVTAYGSGKALLEAIHLRQGLEEKSLLAVQRKSEMKLDTEKM